MSTFAELPAVLRLHLCHASLNQAQEIRSHFGSIDQACLQPRSEWQKSGILTESQLQTLFDESLEPKLEQALSWHEMPDQGWLVWGEPEYPQKLLSLPDAPLVLGYRGDASLLDDPQIAIVGSRHASKSGLETAKDFARYLSKQGVTITSGLALGIDAAAHQGGLQGVGKTVAVVATGLDRIYPASNQSLGHQIVEQGVMVSEFPLGSKPLSYHFPKRNRIISGLSLGTLVVEAALKSGSLITARTAIEQGREVFAVPGSIHNPQAKGCHQLIKQGAKLVEEGRDVLEELSPSLQAVLHSSETDAQQSLELDSPSSSGSSDHPLLAFIGYDPISLDELVVVSKMPASSLQSDLLMLEMSGQIEKLSAARWRRLRA